MAAAAKKEAPKAKAKVSTGQRWKNYIIKGSTLERKNKSCPKCGEGNLLAEHKNRRTCGKCKYMEILSK